MHLWRRAFWILLLGALALVVQGTILKSIFPELVTPVFVISLVVFLGFYEASALGAVLAFVLGLQLDMFTGILLGPWAAAFVVTFFVLASLSQRLFVDSALAAFVVVCAACMLSSTIYILLFFKLEAISWLVVWRLLIEAFVSALFAPFLLRLVRRLLLKRERSSSNRFSSARI